MNQWLFPWWGMLRGPWSGTLAQNINPVTSWWSPQFEFNFAGDSRVEADVVADVASYGRQLGILSEAVLDLAGKKQGKALDELRSLVDRIEKIKLQHQGQLVDKLQTGLDQLRKQDKGALKKLLDQYR